MNPETQREHDALVDMLHTCPNCPQVVSDRQSHAGPTPDVTGTPARPTVIPASPAIIPTARIYSVCDAAQAAGETCVQGSKDGKKGFPTVIVPSARDGHGVVCER